MSEKEKGGVRGRKQRGEVEGGKERQRKVKAERDSMGLVITTKLTATEERCEKVNGLLHMSQQEPILPSTP